SSSYTSCSFLFLMRRPASLSTLFPYTTLFRSKVEVRLNETETYNPFDFPEKPFVEDGKLYLLVGQGQDGDYKGGIKALYQSEDRSEEHTSELQSRFDLVCRLLLEKKNM